MKTVATLLVLLICSNWQQLDGATIICMIATPQHNNPSWTQPFFEALAGRGHLLTVISTEADPSIPGISHIPVSNDYDLIKKHYVNEMGYYNKYCDTGQVLIWYEALLGSCRSVAEIDLVKMLDQVKDKYDLIIYDATYSMECLLSKFPNFHNVPVLALSGGKLTTDLMNLVQAEDTINPETIPHFISHLPREMSYWQCIQNHVMYLTESFIRLAVVKPALNGIHKHDYTSREVQVVLLNTHPVLDHVQNIPPNVIEVGGLHIRAESEPLAFSLQEFMERFSEGLIYINLPHIDLMYGMGLKAIENMVTEYSQFGFLWNVNNVKDPKLSESFHNLRTINVLDNMQQNILAQFNIKAFLTHGDTFGLQEAIYNAVPVIVLPLQMDQFNNAQRVYERNLGIQISASNFSVDSLSEALKQIVRDDDYSDAMHQAQLNFRTRQVKPVDQAVWYAERLISQPELFKHLSLPKSLQHSYFTKTLKILVYPLSFVIILIHFVLLVWQCCKSGKKKPKQKQSAKKTKEKIEKAAQKELKIEQIKDTPDG